MIDTSGELDIPRDRYKRPLIIQSDGSLVGYTRISGLARELDSGFGLKAWSNAMTALGMVLDEGIYEDVRRLADGVDPYSLHKSELIALAEAAQESAGSTVKRELGKELHAYSELLDRNGGDIEAIPEHRRADIEAYYWATAELDVLATELFVVVDELQAAGTLDRLLAVQGGWLPPYPSTPWARVVVGDIKTGQSEPEHPMAVEIQTALYAHGLRYDPETGRRTPLHPGIDWNTGLLIHAPAGKARCDLYPLDLRRGWENACHAVNLKQARKLSGRKLRPLQPIGA